MLYSNRSLLAVNGKSDGVVRPCRTCGAPFELDRPNAKDCPSCRGPDARLKAYVKRHAAELDLFAEPETNAAHQDGQRARDRAASKAEAQRYLARFAPIARELARQRPDGITVADVRIEAERRGMEWPEHGDFLGSLMQHAGLVATDRMRRSPIREQHGRRQMVWMAIQ